MLYKRITRELRESFGAYFAVAVIITLGLGTVLGGNAGDDSMISAIQKFQADSNIEDGSFITFSELSEEVAQELSDKNVSLEKAFYYDLESGDSTLRIFEIPNDINFPNTEEGVLPVDSDDIWLEKHYTQKNEINQGTTIDVEDLDYTVAGIGSLPQYIHVLKNISDLSSDTENFSVGLMTKEGIERIEKSDNATGITRVYQYTYILPENMSTAELKSYLLDEESVYLISFLNGENNPRITDYIADCAMVKKSTFIFALIFMFLMAYVICIFTQNRIEKESAYIGTLYALGYRKNELIRHYLALPVLSAFVGGIGSLLAGKYIFSRMLTQDSIELYSIPDFSISMPLYIIAFGLIVPAVVTAFVGWIILGIKLSETPLALIRGNVKQGLKLNIKLARIGYVGRFRFRQFTREIVGNIVLIIGLFSATVLLILGCSIYGTIHEYSSHVLDNVPYEYMYYTNSELNDIPDDAELVIIKNFESYLKLGDVDLDIIMMGIKEDSDYYEIAHDDGKIVLSQDVADKFGVTVGEYFELYDSLEEEKYRFEVTQIIPYSNALYVFMDYDSMKAEIKGAMQYAVISREDIEFSENAAVISSVSAKDYIGAAEDMLESLMLFIIALVGSSAAIVALVAYLMLKFMVDKAVFGISMLQIFGYRTREVNKIYLGGEFYTVCISIIISLPLGSFIVDKLMTYLTSGYSAYLHMYIAPIVYILMALFEIIVYIVVHMYECRYIASINYVDILKNRE